MGTKLIVNRDRVKYGVTEGVNLGAEIESKVGTGQSGLEHFRSRVNLNTSLYCLYEDLEI